MGDRGERLCELRNLIEHRNAEAPRGFAVGAFALLEGRVAIGSERQQEVRGAAVPGQRASIKPKILSMGSTPPRPENDDMLR